MKSSFWIILMIGVVLIACEEFKYPLDSLPAADVNTSIGETLYVQQNPVWTGFLNRPQDIIIGNEPFIYVADTDNDRIAMLDLAGRPIAFSQPIRRPIALAQDKRLNLLVCAEFDTLLPGRSQPTTFGAVYKLNLVAANHAINLATPVRVYFEPGDSSRRFTGVASLYNNQYYVTRLGPKNAIDRLDKDIAVMHFLSNDQFVSPIANLTPEGTGLRSLHSLTSIATMPTGRSVEFVISQTGEKALFKVQWIRLVQEGQVTYFDSKFYSSVDGDIDLLKINRFRRPQDVTLDPSGNLFVVDAESDSLYRFSSRGAEKYSFGGTGSGERQFRQPHGVAFFDKTVYVADTGNNRIVRFKLSTDIR